MAQGKHRATWDGHTAAIIAAWSGHVIAFDGKAREADEDLSTGDNAADWELAYQLSQGK